MTTANTQAAELTREIFDAVQRLKAVRQSARFPLRKAGRANEWHEFDLAVQEFAAAYDRLCGTEVVQDAYRDPKDQLCRVEIFAERPGA